MCLVCIKKKLLCYSQLYISWAYYCIAERQTDRHTDKRETRSEGETDRNRDRQKQRRTERTRLRVTDCHRLERFNERKREPVFARQEALANGVTITYFN